MKKYRLIIILFSLIISSCYEDKGNYEYSDIKELTIKIPAFPVGSTSKSIDANFGDIVKLTPEFNINIPEDAPYMSYEWALRGKTREGWNKRNFEWVTDTIMPYTDFSFEATDHRTGLKFASTTRFQVKSIFSAVGWMVLSEIDGKSIISFVKKKETTNGYVSKVEVFKDAYKFGNKEGELGQNPTDFQEHFCDEDFTVGQFIIFQDTPVDIDGLFFKKVLNLSQTFEGENMPKKIVGGAFMDYLDILQDDKGQLYTRLKSTNQLFHSDYFLSTPIKFENEVLTDCNVIRGRYVNPKATLIHDRNKERFLYMFDGNTNAKDDPLKNAGLIVPMPEKPAYGTIPAKYFPLNNTSTYDIIHIIYGAGVGMGATYRMLIRDKSTGKYFYQYFEINKTFNTTDFTIGNMKVEEIKGLNFEPDEVCFQSYPKQKNNSYIFLSKGDKLYIYDLDYPNIPVEVYVDFGKDYSTPVKITSMNSDIYNNMNFSLGLSNGDFCIVRVDGAKNFTTDSEKIEIRLDPENYLGNIIKVYPKIGSLGSWTN